jgi:anti-sigma B factor antagonist
MVRAQAAMTFEATTVRQPGATIVTFRGELDIASEADAAATLEAALDGAGMLVADLRELDFLDSTGVRVLLTADLRAREHGVRFGVARGQGMVRRLFEVTRIDQRFPVVDDPVELMGGEPPPSAAAQ